MVRARSGKSVIRKRKRLHKLTKGYRLGRGNLVKQAKITLQRAGAFALRDRRVKKRTFRLCGSSASTPPAGLTAFATAS
jgi:large subunit ribosomal protein L20